MAITTCACPRLRVLVEGTALLTDGGQVAWATRCSATARALAASSPVSARICSLDSGRDAAACTAAIFSGSGSVPGRRGLKGPRVTARPVLLRVTVQRRPAEWATRQRGRRGRNPPRRCCPGYVAPQSPAVASRGPFKINRGMCFPWVRTGAEAGTRTPSLPFIRRPICVDHDGYQILQLLQCNRRRFGGSQWHW